LAHFRRRISPIRPAVPLRTIEGPQTVIDSLAANIAILAMEGTILAGKHVWERFARENGIRRWTARGSARIA